MSVVIQTLVTASRRRATLQESEALAGAQLATAEIPAAVAYLGEHPDYTGYHLLFALRRTAPVAYRELSAEIRAAILCSALANLDYLNDWGHLALDLPLGPPAEALVETGVAASARLVHLLDDTRPAPFYGSMDATLGSQYRRCDFASRCLAAIAGLPWRFDTDVAARDEAIAGLRRSVAAR